MYILEKERILQWVVRNKVDKVIIQAPNGLKQHVREIIDLLEENGVTVFISASHTWGGCDIVFDEAYKLGVKYVLHIGHHGPHRVTIPDNISILFIPAYFDRNPTPIFDKALEEIKDKKVNTISIATSVQHIKWLRELRKKALNYGFRVNIRKGVGGLEGLVIGCEYSAIDPEADEIFIVSGGYFHALGAALWSRKDVWKIDPYLSLYERVSYRKVVSRRLYNITNAMDAKKFLIIVSVKPGQYSMETALKAKRLIIENNRSADIAVFNDVTMEKIQNLGKYDAYLNTACPRLAVDDSSLFPSPVINPGELKYVLKRSLDDYDPRDSISFSL